MNMNLKRLSCWVSLMMLGTFNFATADDDRYSRASLTGLRGVYVLVENFQDAELERAGLTRAAIRTDAESRLRQAGISILTNEERLKTPGYPTLYINAVITVGSSGLGTSTSVRLQQSVRLDRDPSIKVIEVPTWSVESGGGITTRSDVARSVRNRIKEKVDRFINAYLAANLKK